MGEAATPGRISVGGRLVVELGDESNVGVARELDPCPVAQPDEPVDIAISRRAQIPPPIAAERAGDGGDGWVSALAPDGLHLMRARRGACVVDGLPGELPLRITSDASLPTWVLMREVVRPLLQLGLPVRGAGSVHAAAVVRPAAGVLIAGWSESGKTEVALALAERGWGVLADKWTVVDGEGRMAAFPVRAGIRRWVLDYLPRLRSALPRPTRWRMGAAGAVSRGVDRTAGRAGSPLAGAALDLVQRAGSQGERLSMTLSELRNIYGVHVPGHPPLTLAVMLRTVASGRPVARPLPVETLLKRLQESASYERRGGFGLLLRRRFAGGDDAVLRALAGERALLAAGLSQVPVIEVTCPFPSDPRPVADLVEAHL